MRSVGILSLLTFFLFGLFGAREAGALGLVKLDSPDPVTTDSDLTYTLTATNDTAADLEQADLSDTLPTGTTFVSLSAPAGWTCSTPAVGGTGTVSCSATPFATGDSVFTVVVHVALSVAPATTIDNQVDLAVTDSGRTTNLSASASTLVLSPTTVTATKSVAGGTEPGSSVVYTVVLTNTSTHNQGDYAGDEFTDVLPAGVTLVSASATSGTATATIATNTVTWNGSLGPGASVTITIQATIVAGLGSTVSNQGTLAYDADGNGTNEAAGVTDDPTTGAADDPTSFVVLSPATLTATKTVSADHAPGHGVTYIVVVTNQGPATQGDYAGDEFTDVLPAGVTLVSASATSGTATATIATNTVTWNGSLAPSASVTITIQATIVAGLGSTVSNQGTLAYDADGNGTNEAAGVTDDPTTGAADDPTSFVVLSPATLTATKTASADHASTHALTYTVVVTNQGPQMQLDNPGDEFTDVLPAGIALASASATSGTATATIATNTVTWNGSLAPSASVTITVEATIVASPDTTVSNQGTLAYDADGNGTNEAAGVTDDPGVGGAADPTSFVVAFQPTVEIPTTGGLGLGLLALLVALAGAAILRLRS